jgi:Zn-dependent protease
MMGRVTLNPIKHIDPIGTILVPAVLLLMPGGLIFGWAKPVPINFNALKSPRKDMIWVALAGPAANILMTIGWLLVITFTTNLDSPALVQMAAAGIFINLILAVFNLLPIPPLDGSRVISALLPRPLAYKYNQLEQYGLYIILALMFFGGFEMIVWPIVVQCINWLSFFAGPQMISAIIELLS